jgi:hypothetical protein
MKGIRAVLYQFSLILTMLCIVQPLSRREKGVFPSPIGRGVRGEGGLRLMFKPWSPSPAIRTLTGFLRDGIAF